jgi:hypothetical protein
LLLYPKSKTHSCNIFPALASGLCYSFPVQAPSSSACGIEARVKRREAFLLVRAKASLSEDLDNNRFEEDLVGWRGYDDVPVAEARAVWLNPTIHPTSCFNNRERSTTIPLKLSQQLHRTLKATIHVLAKYCGASGSCTETHQ